jgi:hypothetical protein
MSIRQELSAFIQNIDAAGAGYESWGKVSVQRIAVRDGQSIYATSSLSISKIAPINTTDEEDKMIAAIFVKRKNINCVMITRQEYASKLQEEVPPILDDQAQLLGVSIRIAYTTDSNKATSRILWALSSRFGGVCSDGRCICVGGTVDDAYIAAQLLEKTSKAYLEALYIGGAKSINRFEAWAMQMYFQFKYAKEAKKNR